MPIDAVGDLRIMRNEELAGAIPGTALLLDVQLWNAEHRPSFEQLERWGYERDATLGTDDLRDPLAFLRYAGEISRVELWIKRK